jgi:hypothetical protein
MQLFRLLLLFPSLLAVFAFYFYFFIFYVYTYTRATTLNVLLKGILLYYEFVFSDHRFQYNVHHEIDFAVYIQCR